MWWVPSALAVEPPWRWVTSDQGLAAEHVDDLAQAPDGFLWLATHAGVYRYDGVRAVRMDGGALSSEVFRIVVDGAGRVYVRMGDGALYRVTGTGAVRIVDADGAAGSGRDLEVDDAGRAWALSRGRLWKIVDDRLVLDPDYPEVARAHVARFLGPDGWVIGTPRAWWRVAEGQPARMLVEGDGAGAVDAVGQPDGSVWVVDTNGPQGGLVRKVLSDGTIAVSYRYASRAMGIAVDGTRVWASFDNALVKFPPDGPPERWGPERGVTTGGRVRVDAEGSLWIATFRGVAQLFEPDAALYDARDGLPGAATRFLAREGDRLWWSGWGGAGWLDAGGVHLVDDPVVKGAICVDATGGVWALGTAGLDGPAQVVRMTPLGSQRWPVGPSSHFENGCAPAPDGGAFVTASDGLYHASPGGPPMRIAPWWRPDVGPAWKVVDVDARGRPWVAAGVDVCALDEGRWDCLDGAAPTVIAAFVLTEAGSPWIATTSNGVLRRTATGWSPIPGGAALPSRHVMGLRRSSRGGVWVLGHGVVARVVERPDLSDGWRVDETLAGWLGHLVSGAMDALEDGDGDLWIAHNGGLTHVPADTRTPVNRPPPVSLVEARVDGRPLTDGLVAASTTSVTSLRFAAASFVSPARIRYRSRVDGGPWSAPVDHGTVDVRDLAAGSHTIDVAASLDGLTWTAPPATAIVTYPLPWYGRWELWVGLGTALAVAVAAAARVRAAMALRLERLRSRIAIDLHDQVGAELGSIGLLGGLLAREGLPAPAAREAARRVSAIADDLGLVLRGIVWSLRPESARLDQLGAHLAERARGLLPGLDRAGLLTLEVDAPPVPMDLDVLRATQLIGLEALHNVAKHASATHARLAFEAADDGRWRLVVEDDGVGVGDGVSARVDGGNGLRGMKARAAALGFPIAIGPGPRGGTRVVFTFWPRRRWWFTLGESR